MTAITPLDRACLSVQPACAAVSPAAGIGVPESQARKRPLDAGAFFMPASLRALRAARLVYGGRRGGAFGLAGPVTGTPTPCPSATPIGVGAADSSTSQESTMSSTRKPGPQGAADRLSETLDTVRASPAPANAALRDPFHRLDKAAPTTATAFSHIPVADACLLEVRAGIPGRLAVSEAQSLLSYVAERLEEGVQDGITSSEAYGLEFALRAAVALYSAAGAEV